jgi:NAD(P)-dependent dehydrogenase (short-subunit alcohol dehydrogenase family)
MLMENPTVIIIGTSRGIGQTVAADNLDVSKRRDLKR